MKASYELIGRSELSHDDIMKIIKMLGIGKLVKSNDLIDNTVMLYELNDKEYEYMEGLLNV